MKYQHLVSRLLVCMFSTVLSQASNSALAQDSSTKPDLSGVGRPILYSEPLEPLPNVKPASANGFFWHILHSLGLAKDIKTFTWMVNRVELIKLDSIQSDTQNDKRSYYLLAVPANLPTGNQNVHYLSLI